MKPTSRTAFSNPFLRSLLAACALSLVGSASAATTINYTYQTISDITSTSWVIPTGSTTVTAVNFGSGGTTNWGGASWVNGFNAFPTPGTISVNFAGTTRYGGYYPYSAGNATGILNEGMYGDSSKTLDLSGFTVGQKYLVQFVVADTRGDGVEGRTITIDGSSANIASQDSSAYTFAYSSGNFAVVTAGFTPAAGDTAFSFIPLVNGGSAGTQMNGLQVLAAETDVTWTNSASNMTWSSTDGNWSVGPVWQYATNNAIFGATGVGTVNLAAETIGVHNVTFDTAGYTIASNTLTLNNSTITTNADAAISSTLAGTTGLIKAGAGKLTLTGANSYGGTTTISGGTLQIGNGGSTGSLGSGAIENNANLVYNFDATSTVSLPSGSNISGSGNLSATAGVIRFNGNITQGGALSFTQTGAYAGYKGLELATTTTLTGSSITLSGDVGKKDSNGNSLTLDTSASNGTITLDISLGRENVWYIPSSFSANAGTGAINITGSGIDDSGWRDTPVTLTGALNMTGNVHSNAAVTIDSNTTTSGSVSGTFSGGMSLTKSGAGTLTISGASNTYTGSTTVKAGTLVAGTSNGVTGISSASAVLLGDTTGSADATLQLGSSSTTSYTNNVRVQSGNTGVAALNGSGFINLSGTVTLGTDDSSGKGLTIANVGSDSNWIYDLQGVIQDPSSMTTGTAGTVTIGSTGTGTVRFSAANTYTGDTRLAANYFQINNTNALQNSTLNLATGDKGTVSAINQDSTLGGLKGTRDLNMQGCTLSIGNNGQSTAYSGILSNGALTKIGTGTLTLSGTNSYTGATTVSAGRLVVNGTQSGATGGVSVASGATLGGTGTVGGTTTINSGGILAPGNSPGVLTTDVLTLNSGSIFEWELDTSKTNPETNRGEAYDGVNTNTLTANTGVHFKIALTGTQSFSDTFWDTSRSWTDIFKNQAGNTILTNWVNVFKTGDTTNFQYFYNGVTTAPTSQGHFTLTANTLTWTAVPEPTSALAGLLITAGLLRRRRETSAGSASCI